MNKRIQTYADLCEEKQRLENLLALQKQLVQDDWVEIKEKLSPVEKTISFIGKFTTRNKSNSLLNFGLDIAGDLLLKKFVFARAGWLTKLAVPYIIKNYSSNVLGGKKVSIFKTIGKIFGRKKAAAIAELKPYRTNNP